MRLIHESKNILVLQDLSFQLEDELVLFDDTLIFFMKNFELNGSTLKPDHFQFIRDLAARNLQAPHRVCEIYAMTDTSGTNQVNFKVAGERLNSVQSALVTVGVSPTKVFTRFAKSLGEEFAATKMKDDQKLPGARAVQLAISSSPLGIPTRNFENNVFGDVIRFGRRFLPVS